MLVSGFAVAPVLRGVWAAATSRVGMVVLAAALAGWWGYGRAQDACKADELRQQIEAMRSDIVAAREAERRAAQQAAILAVEAASNQERVDELMAGLDALPADDVCRASDDDIGRLLGIR